MVPLPRLPKASHTRMITLLPSSSGDGFSKFLTNDGDEVSRSESHALQKALSLYTKVYIKRLELLGEAHEGTLWSQRECAELVSQSPDEKDWAKSVQLWDELILIGDKSKRKTEGWKEERDAVYWCLHREVSLEEMRTKDEIHREKLEQWLDSGVPLA